ncbi:hypothetical protein [Bradyrhizobium sp. STM 3557]|uniref:hypothetical protein n=1 Tax=Bradyrhizobium sp. STM 3557 TaxID=578920 RepID=UPI00388FEB35
MDKAAMARADRLQARRAELAKLTSGELTMLATDRGVAIDPTDTREEREFALASAMIDAEDAEAAATAAKEQDERERRKREAFYKTKEGKALIERELRQTRDRRIRQQHAAFIGALPSDARSKGVHVVPDSHAGAASPDVPDGTYRVSGSDWLLSFSGGRWVQASRAHDRGHPDWTEIPDVEGASVAARARPTTVDE